MIIVNHLSISYETEQVLHNFSCHIEKGQFVCIQGKSGGGKTSLLKALIGLSPFQGEIIVGGIRLSGSTCEQIRKHTAYLSQELSFPCETIQEMIKETWRIGGVKDTPATQQLLSAYLQSLGITDLELLHKGLGQVSGGQRQRILLATIALLDKEIWLLDEPTAALDIESRDLVIDFLLSQKAAGKTLLVVTHDPHLVAAGTDVISL